MENRKKLGNVKIAEDMREDEYDKIDDFGKSMLTKMGWKENERLNNKDPVKIVEFKPRPPGLGLGATQLDVKAVKNEKRITLYGQKVKITEGKHKGLKGIIKDDIEALTASGHINIELKVNKQTVKVRSEYIKLRKGENEEEKVRVKKVKLKKLVWICPGIIVRVVNKDSKYYNTKAFVEDVLDDCTFSLITNDGVLHMDFLEEDVETVMPGVNENLKILNGRYRGEIAKLLERDKKNNKIVVQLLSDLSIENYTQDDCSAVKHL
jgi:hypothetical protein